jgi:polysaccharide export outer membrane protein
LSRPSSPDCPAAEGFTYRANKAKVYIKKEGDTAEHEYRISTDTPVSPGDTIRITERYF